MKSANLYSWPEFFLKNPSSYWVFFLFAIVACLPIVAPIDSRLLGGDFGWPIHFQTFLNATLSTWDDSVGFGYPAPRQQKRRCYCNIGVIKKTFSFGEK